MVFDLLRSQGVRASRGKFDLVNLGSRWVSGRASRSKPARTVAVINRSLAGSGDKAFRDSSSRLDWQLGASVSLLTRGLLTFRGSLSIKFLECSFSF